MSFAVHDCQLTQQNWNTMYTSQKRKHTTISRHENNELHDLRSNTPEKTRKELPRVSYKRNSTSKPGSPLTTPHQFLIDGTPPISPHPTLVEKKREVRHGPGRHRSVDLKGLIMELIDESYPPTVCPTCLNTASGRSEADLHFKTEHHGEKAFQCLQAQCDQAYSSKPGLRYHLEHAHRVTLVSDSTESPRRSDRHSASVKNSVETKKSRQTLPQHLHDKLEEIYSATVCPSCNQDFKRKTHVIQHLVQEHHGEEPYKCIVPDCKRTKAYATREGLVYHLASYHDTPQQ